MENRSVLRHFVTGLHAFKMTGYRLRRKFLRPILFLFLLPPLAPGFADFSDLNVRWVPLLLLLLIISSKSDQVTTSSIGLSLFFYTFFHTPVSVSAEEGDWSTEWSSWSHKKVVTRRPSVIVKERLKGESVVFDIKKAEVGVRYRVVVDDYGIRQLIPIDVPVYREEEDFDGVDVSGIDPGLKVRTRHKKRIRPSPKWKTCHRRWHSGLKTFGEIQCLRPEKSQTRRKVTRRPTTTTATTTTTTKTTTTKRTRDN